MFSLLETATSASIVVKAFVESFCHRQQCGQPASQPLMRFSFFFSFSFARPLASDANEKQQQQQQVAAAVVDGSPLLPPFPVQLSASQLEIGNDIVLATLSLLAGWLAGWPNASRSAATTTTTTCQLPKSKLGLWLASGLPLSERAAQKPARNCAERARLELKVF